MIANQENTNICASRNLWFLSSILINNLGKQKDFLNGNEGLITFHIEYSFNLVVWWMACKI